MYSYICWDFAMNQSDGKFMCSQQQPVRSSGRGLLKRFGDFMAGSSPSRHIFHRVTTRCARSAARPHESSRVCVHAWQTDELLLFVISLFCARSTLYMLMQK